MVQNAKYPFVYELFLKEFQPARFYYIIPQDKTAVEKTLIARNLSAGVRKAIASGLPLVAVQDEAFEGMLENDLNGYSTPLDVNAYAETIIKLLQDNKRIESFGKHSAILSEKYSIEGQVKALEKLYTEAIASSMT